MKMSDKTLLFLGMAALLFAGCSRDEVEGVQGTEAVSEAQSAAGTQEKGVVSESLDAQAGGAAPKGTIAISVLDASNPFFQVIDKSLTAEAAKYGYKVLAVSGDLDVAKQHNQVKDFIVKKVTAIVLCPCESTAIGSAIKEANAAGIPVFTADIACLAPGVEVVSHIATDNLSGGREAGKAMIEALDEAGGEVVILDFKSAESCLLRVQGFKEVIGAHNKQHPDQEISIVMELPGEGQRHLGYKRTEDAIQAYPDLAGIFAINDPSALGARAALEKAGKADQVKIIGFDGQPEGKQAIKEGKIYADPVQFPAEIGRITMQTILAYLSGEEVEPEILIPTKLYRQSDAENDPELRGGRNAAE